VKYVAVIDEPRTVAVTPVSGLPEREAQVHADLWTARGHEARLVTVTEWRAYARRAGVRTHTRRA